MSRAAMQIRSLTLLGIATLSAFAIPTPAHAGEPTPNREARAWFQDARLGLFVHWGVYSLLEKGEWVMEHDRLPISEYAKLPPRFTASKFDAQAWVALAKAAGARYLTVTAKHHDGFCMFDSALTDYDVVDSTPFHTDPIKALAEACRQQDVKLFLYYSLLDWHHPDYDPRGKTGHFAGRQLKGTWKHYVAYYQGQVRELCTRYGAIGGIWFDGEWDRPGADWDLAGTYRMIHELQPHALVANNHHAAPLPGEDFQIFEQDLPGENKAGFNKARIQPGLPLETCLTINSSWGYNAADENYKSVSDLVHALARASGRGANLLLNVGPLPDGSISATSVTRLRELGQWLTAHEESIRGTHAGPIPEKPWGVSTARGPVDHPTAIYLHVFHPGPDTPIVLDRNTPWQPRLLGRSVLLETRATKSGAEIVIPDDIRDPIDTVIMLEPKPAANR